MNWEVAELCVSVALLAIVMFNLGFTMGRRSAMQPRR
jgi:hypothetical protein